MKNKLIFISFLLTIINSYSASDAYFYNGKPRLTHLNAAPLYYNPSFAGMAGKSRFCLDYKMDMLSFYDNYSETYERFSNPTNYHISFDSPLNSIKAAVGLIFNKTYAQGLKKNFDYLGANKYIKQLFSLNTYQGIVYSQKFSVNRTLTFSPSIKLSYTTTQVFPRVDIYQDGPHYQHLDTIFQGQITDHVDLCSGLLINNRNFYVGFAVDHLLMPQVSFVSSGQNPWNVAKGTPDSLLPYNGSSVLIERKLKPVYIFQLGYTYQKKPKSNFSVSANLLLEYISFYKKYSLESYIANVTFKYKWASLGVGSSSNDGEKVLAMVGIHTKNFILGYSKNMIRSYGNYAGPKGIVLGRNFNQFDSSNEVSLKYIFNFKKTKDK